MNFNKKTIEDIDVKGKKVLVRCDFNVPLKDGVITDENRLNGALPTIKYLMENGAKVILCSHLGKDASKSLAPVAKRLSEMLGKEVVFARDEEVVGANAKAAVAAMNDGDVVLLENTRCRKEETKNVEEFSKELAENGAKVILCSHLGKDASKSLAPVAKRLSEMLGKEVVFARDEEVVGANAKAAVAAMNDGDVVLLENTRCRKEETKNVEEFSKELASLADIFVNDAFGTAHRAHCSTVGVTEFLDTAVCGYLIQKELKFLGEAVNAPVRPFVAILGGSKVSDKIAVINNLLEKVNTIIIGGGMAYTFLKAQGYEIGTSLCEDDRMDYAKEMIAKAEANGVKFLLPVDHRIADGFNS